MPKMSVNTLAKLLVCFLIPLGVLMMPIDAIPIDDLTLISIACWLFFFLLPYFGSCSLVPVFATSFLLSLLN